MNSKFSVCNLTSSLPLIILAFIDQEHIQSCWAKNKNNSVYSINDFLDNDYCFQCNLLCYISWEVYAHVKEESYQRCSHLCFSIPILNIIIRLLILRLIAPSILSIFLFLKRYLGTKDNRWLEMVEDITDHHIPEYYHHWEDR